LRDRRGVCQDFAIFNSLVFRSQVCLRGYVSGTSTDPPPGQTKLRGADASHALGQLSVPAWAGWLWNHEQLTPSLRHLPAGAATYGDIGPVRGVWSAARTRL